MIPEVPFLARSFRAARTATLKLGTNAVTWVTDAEELAEYSTSGICSKNMVLPFCERSKL
jgi:hypothetical protein